MNSIDVQIVSRGVFQVVVRGNGTETKHTVTMTDEERGEYAPEGINDEDLVKKSFEFLLEREPKESILSEFSLSTIEHYFPEFKEYAKS